MSSILTPTSPSRSILIFTCSEFGQANVSLALLYELLRNDDGFDIHIASHERLQLRVESVTADLDRKATFHAIPVPTGEELSERHGGAGTHPPGLAAVTGYRRVAPFLAGYAPSEYASAYDACVKIIQDVRPACAAVDMIFPMGFDACHTQKLPVVRISPLAVSHAVVACLPRLQMFWKYPFVGTGFPYPLPWHLIPINIYLVIQMFRLYGMSTQITNLNKLRKQSLGIDGLWPQFQLPGPEFPCINAGLPELDHPVEVPNYVKPCGPIMLPSKTLQEIDPELAEWLGKPARGTVLVQMGTHWDHFAEDYERDIVEMASGIKMLLDDTPGVQVLWKLKLKVKTQKPPPPPSSKSESKSEPKTSTSTSYYASAPDPVQHLLSSPNYASRIRIVPWLHAPPSSILLSFPPEAPHLRHIIATVHHGGANSFYEAARSGIAQIILPVWYDTYDFAVKAEYLGIGVWANKGTAPEVDGRQLGEKLLMMVRDVKENGFRNRARLVGESVRVKGEGREKAAEELLSFAREVMERGR